MPKGIPSLTLRKVSTVGQAATEQKLPGPRPKHGLTTLRHAVAKHGRSLAIASSVICSGNGGVS